MMVAGLVVEDVVDDDVLGVEDVDHAVSILCYVAAHVPAQPKAAIVSAASWMSAQVSARPRWPVVTPTCAIWTSRS
jgi:hypothetical protein